MFCKYCLLLRHCLTCNNEIIQMLCRNGYPFSLSFEKFAVAKLTADYNEHSSETYALGPQHICTFVFGSSATPWVLFTNCVKFWKKEIKKSFNSFLLFVCGNICLGKWTKQTNKPTINKIRNVSSTLWINVPIWITFFFLVRVAARASSHLKCPYQNSGYFSVLV